MKLSPDTMELIRSPHSKINPALYYTPSSDLITVESQLSPHDGQRLLCEMDYAGNPLEDSDLTEQDVIRMAEEWLNENECVEE